MLSPRLTQKLDRLNDETQAYLETHIDLLLAMPAHCRPLHLLDLRPGPDVMSRARVLIGALYVPRPAKANLSRRRGRAGER